MSDHRDRREGFLNIALGVRISYESQPVENNVRPQVESTEGCNRCGADSDAPVVGFVFSDRKRYGLAYRAALRATKHAQSH